MKKGIAVLLVLISLAASSIVFASPAVAQSSQGITIIQNGDIAPSTAPMRRDGYVYTLTADLTESISIETGSVVLDGAGHSIQGVIGGFGVNIVASNVVVENLQVTNCKTGILGTYNNNTIAIASCHRTKMVWRYMPTTTS